MELYDEEGLSRSIIFDYINRGVSEIGDAWSTDYCDSHTKSPTKRLSPVDGYHTEAAYLQKAFDECESYLRIVSWSLPPHLLSSPTAPPAPYPDKSSRGNI